MPVLPSLPFLPDRESRGFWRISGAPRWSCSWRSAWISCPKCIKLLTALMFHYFARNSGNHFRQSHNKIQAPFPNGFANWLCELPCCGGFSISNQNSCVGTCCVAWHRYSGARALSFSASRFCCFNSLGRDNGASFQVGPKRDGDAHDFSPEQDRISHGKMKKRGLLQSNPITSGCGPLATAGASLPGWSFWCSRETDVHREIIVRFWVISHKTPSTSFWKGGWPNGISRRLASFLKTVLQGRICCRGIFMHSHCPTSDGSFLAITIGIIMLSHHILD